MKKLFLMLLLLGTFAVAQEKKVVVRVDDDDDAPMSPRGHEMMMNDDDDDAPMPPMEHRMMMEHLKLTDDQQKQVGKLHDEMEKKQIELHSKIQLLHVDLRGLFRDEKPNQDKIELKISEISKLQTEAKLAHIGMWFSVNKLLTPEQQKTWKKIGMMRMQGMGPMPMMKHRMKIMKGHKEHEEKDDDD